MAPGPARPSCVICVPPGALSLASPPPAHQQTRPEETREIVAMPEFGRRYQSCDPATICGDKLSSALSSLSKADELGRSISARNAYHRTAQACG